MQFKTLSERMEYYKSIADYKLMPNSYVIAHIDGRAFSTMIKKRYDRPFSDIFIRMMDETAAYLCKYVMGAKMAFVQSDEISLILTDFDNPKSGNFFSYRLCKMQSIIASMATAKFSQLAYLDMFNDEDYCPEEIFSDDNLFQFDCKCFNVPTYNDAFAWIKYRQNDCIRNSKQQLTQFHYKEGQLKGKNTDEQIAMLLRDKGIDWYKLPQHWKYGRLVYREEYEKTDDSGHPIATRHRFASHPAPVLDRDVFDSLGLVPDMCGFELSEERKMTDFEEYVGQEGTVTGLLNDGFTFVGKLDNGEEIKFQNAEKMNLAKPQTMQIGCRMRIVSYRKGDFMLFAEKVN